MTKFLLFSYETFDPMGGLSDFVGAFDTIEEAKQAADGCSTIQKHWRNDYQYIVSADSFKVIFSREKKDNKNVYSEWEAAIDEKQIVTDTNDAIITKAAIELCTKKGINPLASMNPYVLRGETYQEHYVQKLKLLAEEINALISIGAI